MFLILFFSFMILYFINLYCNNLIYFISHHNIFVIIIDNLPHIILIYSSFITTNYLYHLIFANNFFLFFIIYLYNQLMSLFIISNYLFHFMLIINCLLILNSILLLKLHELTLCLNISILISDLNLFFITIILSFIFEIIFIINHI